MYLITTLLHLKAYLDFHDQVICHSGLDDDKARAAKLIKMVSDRYGHLVNVS